MTYDLIRYIFYLLGINQQKMVKLDKKSKIGKMEEIQSSMTKVQIYNNWYGSQNDN